MPHKKKKAFHRNAQRSAADFYEKPLASSGKKSTDYDDDTPKSFLRLVKRKSRKELIAQGKVDTTKKEKKITIQPGESFSDFRRRVDKEIPVRLGSMGKEERRPKKKKKPTPAVQNEQEDEEEPKKKRRRGKQKRSVSPDPWAHLKKDVPFNQPVQAPPALPAPTRQIKSSLPNSLSGAKRDILESERQDVIAKYRQLMGRT